MIILLQGLWCIFSWVIQWWCYDVTVNRITPDRRLSIFASHSSKERFSGAILHCSKQVPATARRPKTFHMMQHLSPARTACTLTGVGERGGAGAFLSCRGLLHGEAKWEAASCQSVNKDACAWSFKKTGKNVLHACNPRTNLIRCVDWANTAPSHFCWTWWEQSCASLFQRHWRRATKTLSDGQLNIFSFSCQNDKLKNEWVVYSFIH